jgi:hypothetical protein
MNKRFSLSGQLALQTSTKSRIFKVLHYCTSELKTATSMQVQRRTVLSIECWSVVVVGAMSITRPNVVFVLLDDVGWR